MEIISKLLGSEAKAKIIRLFLFNPETIYSVREVSLRTDIKGARATAAISALSSIGLIRKKSVMREVKDMKKGRSKKVKETVYFLDEKFPYNAVLFDLMAAASLKADERLAAKFASIGKIKLVIASGIFVRQNDARLDVLIVGDDINESKLAHSIKALETEIGHDLAYSNLSTADFEYRIGLNDRLIRDILDFKHVILTDKIGFQTRK